MATKLKVATEVAGVDQTTVGHIGPAPTIPDVNFLDNRLGETGAGEPLGDEDRA